MLTRTCIAALGNPKENISLRSIIETKYSTLFADTANRVQEMAQSTFPACDNNSDTLQLYKALYNVYKYFKYFQAGYLHFKKKYKSGWGMNSFLIILVYQLLILVKKITSIISKSHTSRHTPCTVIEDFKKG